MHISVGTKTRSTRVGGPEVWISDLWVTGDEGQYLPRFGPSRRGNTYPMSCFDCIDHDVSSTSLIYIEIISCVLTLRLDGCNCDRRVYILNPFVYVDTGDT